MGQNGCYGWSVIALGIDPGTRRLGWGVVSRTGNRLTHVAHGVIALDGDESIASRLVEIESQLTRVIREHRPTVSSVESLFFNKDAQAAAKLGHARGVVLLCLAREGIPIAEYAPAKIKRTIAGTGQADKRQVALMVRAALALDALPPVDASDALAIAMTHLRLGGLLHALEEATEAAPGRAAADSRARVLLALLGKKRPRSRLPRRRA
ncbi:MAG TPA: crossover junction endodeoxyribonuclease RuvC [Polyangiaceae bacterium]|nr:crossover junction endodeoxyribonuclease RuvC [Polyangiaceae bacterium]